LSYRGSAAELGFGMVAEGLAKGAA
jgi:hypothetical protein